MHRKHNPTYPTDNPRFDWPVCRLTSNRIIDALPPGCVGRTGDPHAALVKLRDAGWRELTDPTGNQRAGCETLTVFDACQACIGSRDCWAHPTFQSLRGQQ